MRRRVSHENRERALELARELNRLKRDAGGNGHEGRVTVMGLRGWAEVDYSPLYGWRFRTEGRHWSRKRWRSAVNVALAIVEAVIEMSRGEE
jgi:hypothetical protein